MILEKFEKLTETGKEYPVRYITLVGASVEYPGYAVFELFVKIERRWRWYYLFLLVPWKIKAGEKSSLQRIISKGGKKHYILSLSNKQEKRLRRKAQKSIPGEITTEGHRILC